MKPGDKVEITLERLRDAVVRLYVAELNGKKRSDGKWLAALADAARTVKKLLRKKGA